MNKFIKQLLKKDEEKIDIITSGFWCDEGSFRDNTILNNWEFIIENLAKIISFKAEDLSSEDRPYNSRRSGYDNEIIYGEITAMLECNLRLLNSILCDCHYFVLDGSRGSNIGRVERFMIPVDFNDQAENDKRRLLLKLSYIEPKKTVCGLIDQIIKRRFTDEDLTINKLILELCAISPFADFNWSEWHSRFNAIYPHAANYVINSAAMIALIGSHRKVEILILIRSMEAHCRMYNQKNIVLNLNFATSETLGILNSLEKLANQTHHPLSCDSFICWIRLKCLCETFDNKCREFSKIWNFDREKNSFNKPDGYLESWFAEFLLSVPLPDRKLLKHIMALNFIIFSLIGKKNIIQKDLFILNPDFLNSYQKKATYHGMDVEYGEIMHLVARYRSSDPWSWWVEKGVIDPKHIYSSQFNVSWFRNFMRKLDYATSDLNNSFFTNELLWDERPANWN
jgi:hypothetical protein